MKQKRWTIVLLTMAMLLVVGLFGNPIESVASESIAFAGDKEQEIGAGNHTISYTPEDTGYYTFMANGAGEMYYESEEEDYGPSVYWDFTEAEEIQPVAVFYLRGDVEYYFDLYTETNQNMTLNLVKDTIQKVELTSCPDKTLYLADEYVRVEEEEERIISLSGMVITITFENAGEMTYEGGSSNDVVDWRYECSSEIFDEDEWSKYLEEGNWDVSISINGWEDSVVFQIEVMATENIKNIITKEVKSFDVESYAVYEAESTGYYGMTWVETTDEDSTENTTTYDIDSLYWLEEGKIYPYYIEAENVDAVQVMVAMQQVKITDVELELVDKEALCKWNYELFDVGDVNITLTLDGIQNYKVSSEDYNTTGMELFYKNECKNLWGDSCPLSGENAIVLDYRTGTKESESITVQSIVDAYNVTEIISVGEEKAVTETEGYVYFLLNVEKNSYFEMTVESMGRVAVFRIDNTPINEWEFYSDEDMTGSGSFDAGSYVVCCYVNGENASILFSDKTPQNLKITAYPEEFVEGIDIRDDSTLTVNAGLHFTVTNYDGSEEIFDYWYEFPVDVKYYVDGVEWKDWGDEDYSFAMTKGEHKVTVKYRGVEDSYTYTVISYETFISDSELSVLNLGNTQTSIASGGSSYVNAGYVFKAPETGCYDITVEGAPEEYGWWIYDASGIVCSGDDEEETETSTLEEGYTYYVLFWLDGLEEQTTNVTVTIEKGKTVAAISVVEDPIKDTYIYPIDYNEDDETWFLEGMKLQINYEDGSSKTAEANTSLFDKWNIEYDKDGINLSKSGEYILSLVQDDYGLKYTFAVKVITLEEAEKEGLIGTIEVGEETELEIGAKGSPKLYKVEGTKDSQYFVKVKADALTDVDDDYISFGIYGSEEGWIERFSVEYGNVDKCICTLPEESYISLEDMSGLLEDQKVQISLVEKAIQSVSLKAKPDENVYYQYLGIDYTGASVLVKYTDGEEEIMEYNTDSWWPVGYFEYNGDEEDPKVEFWTSDWEDIYFEFDVDYVPISEYSDSIAVEDNSLTKVSVKKDDRKVVLKFTPEETKTYTFDVKSTVNAYIWATIRTEDRYITEKYGVGSFTMTKELTEGVVYYILVGTEADTTIEITLGTPEEGDEEDTTEPETPITPGDNPVVTPSQPEHSHSYVLATKINATCTTNGYELYRCSCGAEEKRNETTALGHSYSKEWKNDTTHHWHICSCGTKDSYAAHTFQWVVDKEATTTEAGLKHQECSVCGYKQKEGTVVDKLVVPVGTELSETKSNAVYTVTGAGTVAYTKTSSKATKITIPATVTIDGTTYKVTEIAANAFKNNKKITKVTIGSNIITIGANTFSGCKKLKTVTIGKNVTSIGNKAFYKCTALTKITIPAKVTKIGKQAFYGCKKLKSITLKTTKLTTKKVGAKAFKGIYSKATIKVPKSKLSAYKKMLKAKGVGKKAKIKK